MADKIVRFDKWCASCVYSDANPDKVDENPCNDCLYNATNVDSTKPTMYKSSKEKQNYI